MPPGHGAARGLRFPAAIQIFPALKTYVHLRPRRLAAVPIACKAQLKHEDLPACLRHVYHDLGVLVFAGLENAQIERVGDVIRHLVTSGGIGRLMTVVDWRAKSKQSKLRPPQKGDYYTAADWAHSGVLKPRALFDIADNTLPPEITDLILLRVPSVKPSTLQLRERGVIQKGVPQPRGVLHPSVNGPRILPLECFSSLRVDAKFSNVYGEIVLFTGGGKGQFAGSIRVDYSLLQVDEKQGTMKTLWLPKDVGAKDISEYGAKHTNLGKKTTNELTSLVFRPLWKLEREIYGDKADRLVQYDEFKMGLKGWKKPPQISDDSTE